MRSVNQALKAVLFVCLLGLMAGQATADGYIGIDGASLSVNNSIDGSVNPRGLRLRLGQRVAHLVDLELHLGSGHDSGTSVYDRFRTTFAGLYLKGYLPVGQRSALYGLIGGAAVELTQTIDDRQFSDGRGGFSLGFGLETELSDYLDISGDYMRYSFDDDPFSAVDTFSLGLKWYF